MMNDFNLEDFSFGEELEKIINSQQEAAKEVISETLDNDPFAEVIFDTTVQVESNIENETINLDTNLFGEDPFQDTEDTKTEDLFQDTEDIKIEDTKTEDLFGNDIFEDNIFTSEGSVGEVDFGFGQDRYINAMHAFVDYMPINLNVDRDIPSHFESLVDLDSDLPTIVIEKLPNKMIALIHNLRKRPLPAIPTENRQPVVAWNGTIQEFVQPVAHRTLSGAQAKTPRELATLGFLRARSAIIHQTV